MISTVSFKTLRLLTILAFFAVVQSATWGQDSSGSEDLDQAFDLKIKAQSPKDLDEVVKLCESAIEKGLDEQGKVQAEQLAASSLMEHANFLAKSIFASRGQDTRWRIYRSRALKRLEEAIELQPDMVDAYLLIVRLNSLPGGDEDAAKEAVDKAIELAGDDRQQLSNALLMRASLTDDEDAQLSDLDQAIKINPENMDAIRVRGTYYLDRDEPEKAMADIGRWLEAGEENTRDYLGVVTILMGMGDRFDDNLQQEALKIIDKAIAHDPENPLPLTFRAQLNSMRQQPEEAIKDATAALKLAPRNIGVLLLRANVYVDQDQLDEALADLTQVLEQNPLNAEAIQMRGIILSQQDKFDEAIDDIKLLADSNPQNPRLQRQLAMLYNAADRPRDAIKVYDNLLKLFKAENWEGKSNGKKLLLMSERMSVLQGRGDARLSTGEHAIAVIDYEEALTLADQIREIQKEEGAEPFPDDDGVLNNLAWVLATSPDDEVRDGERAIELATKAAEVTEYKQPHILSTLASGYAEAGDFENAIKWIEKGLELNNKEIADEKSMTPRLKRQQESLENEHKSYLDKKPWRELQNDGKPAELPGEEKADPKSEDPDNPETPEPAEPEMKKEPEPKGEATQDDSTEPSDKGEESESDSEDKTEDRSEEEDSAEESEDKKSDSDDADDQENEDKE